MNYKKIYNQLIENAKIKNNNKNKYYELHHILPKCLGGNDDEKNIIKLTLREHYIAHKLLTEIYKDNKSIWHAFWMMTISTIGALENIKKENYFRVDGEKLRRIKPILEGEKINITAHEYEYCREYWRNLIKGVKRTKEQCNNISIATKEAMKTPERIKKCRANKGIKNYYNPLTNKIYRWKPGDPDIDLTIYKWGRPPLSNEQRKKLSQTQKLNKTICKIGNTNFRYCWYKDYIKKIPNCFIDLNCKQKNSLKQISYIINDALSYLKDNNIFIDNYIKFFPYKRGFCIFSPAVYEICLDLFEKNIFNKKIIGNRIFENIEKIKELNKEYIIEKILQNN